MDRSHILISEQPYSESNVKECLKEMEQWGERMVSVSIEVTEGKIELYASFHEKLDSLLRTIGDASLSVAEIDKARRIVILLATREEIGAFLEKTFGEKEKEERAFSLSCALQKTKR